MFVKGDAYPAINPFPIKLIMEVKFGVSSLTEVFAIWKKIILSLVVQKYMKH